MTKRFRKKPKPRPTSWQFFDHFEHDGKLVTKGTHVSFADYTINPETGRNHVRRGRFFERVVVDDGQTWINVVEQTSKEGKHVSTGRVRSIGLARVTTVHRKVNRVLSQKELRERRKG